MRVSFHNVSIHFSLVKTFSYESFQISCYLDNLTHCVHTYLSIIVDYIGLEV